MLKRGCVQEVHAGIHQMNGIGGTEQVWSNVLEKQTRYFREWVGLVKAFVSDRDWLNFFLWDRSHLFSDWVGLFKCSCGYTTFLVLDFFVEVRRIP